MKHINTVELQNSTSKGKAQAAANAVQAANRLARRAARWATKAASRELPFW